VVVPELLVQRRRRPLALIVIAVFAIAAAGAVYLRPTTPNQPRPAPAVAIDPFRVSNYPVNYVFVTPSLGWAAFIVGSSPGPSEFRVFRTTDGGSQWRQQLAGLSSYGPGFSPLAIQFFGKTRGFMTVGEPVEHLYRTDDGGERWVSVSIPFPSVGAITFSSPSLGWLVSYMGPPQIALIYATSDEGKTWQRLPDPPADASDLQLRSQSEAWMGGNDPGTSHVYTSSDGGRSWKRHDLPPPLGARANDQHFQTSIQLLPGTGAVGTVEVFRCLVAAPIGTPSPALPPYGGFVPIGGPTPAPAPVCGNAISETYLYRSVDRGATWTQLPSPPGQVAYQDSVHWWSTSANAVFKSADAGLSWRQVATIPTNLQFSFVTILDSNHAWASVFVMGGYGLAFTHDGGLHWTLAQVPQPA
jgi:photosystem II stability/assembly factor-like uncharacterized protein